MKTVTQAKFGSVLGLVGMVVFFSNDACFLASAILACTFCATAMIIEEVQKR